MLPRQGWWISFGMLLMLPGAVQAADAAAVQSRLQSFLAEGNLAGAVQEFSGNVTADSGDSHSRYALGMTRLLQSVEHLCQNLYRYGLRVSAPDLPVLRLPVPENPDPQRMTYVDVRSLLQQFVDELAVAADVLGEVHDPQVKLVVPIGQIRLDLNGDGTTSPRETFWEIFVRINPRAGTLNDEDKRFEVAFDAADVHWMIGYTHVLRAMVEAWLAQDSEKLHEILAPYLFSGAAPEEAALQARIRPAPVDTDTIADVVAMIHLMSFSLADPERMPRVRGHLLEMVRQSRLSWELITAETDNDREWIPNAAQTSVVGLSMSEERIQSWQGVLNELESVLNGTLLIPHWRLPTGSGINMKRVFEEPRGFDLVLWVHGAAALPYVEEGPVAGGETSRSLTAAFGGQFFLFALWIN